MTLSAFPAPRLLIAARHALGLVLAASLFVSAQAQEQAQLPQRDSTIVVTGENAPVTVSQAQRQARDIVMRTGNILESPLARFEDRLCPGIIGLEPNTAALMIDRIRANAAELDIRIQEDGCRANFMVVFTEDGEAMLRTMMEESPEYFQFLDSGQKRDILEPGPARVWYTVEPRTLTGMPIRQSRELMNPPQIQVFGAHTRIYTTTRNDITSVVITFDRDAIIGLNLGQLADYATMRGLAQVRPAGPLEVDSILTLFETSRSDPDWAPPQRLTDFDRAYLRALYDGMPNLPGFRKVTRVGFELRRLQEEEAEAQE